MPELYIGLMSGTSMDGIDTALVEFNQNKITLVGSHNHNIPADLKKTLQQLSLNSAETNIDMLGEADTHLGKIFADAVIHLLKKTNISAKDVTAIGSHGQTIRHRPDLKNNFSMQIGDANRISYLTGITTVADFRRKDMAAGGQGAPLTPAFHQQVFSSQDENRGVLNIGGISNLTYLPKDKKQHCFGFDSGPGNMLMDAWIQKHKNKNFDKNGDWAASAKADKDFVNLLMRDKFILTPPPKSTGREHYHLHWLTSQLTSFENLSSAQIQASLCQFTCNSIAYAIEQNMPDIDTLIVCGGGVHNSHLMSLLKTRLHNINTQPSDNFGISADWLEAIAFAWLARQTIQNLSGNIPEVTGAAQKLVLGAIYPH